MTHILEDLTYRVGGRSTSSFFPNSFSYGVFANMGSGAVPGRLPNHGFREGSGAGSGAVFRDRVPGRFRGVGRGFRKGSGAGSGQGFEEVPGQVPITEVPDQVPGGSSSIGIVTDDR